MSSAPVSPKLNLLPADRFEYSKLGRFLKWALSAGRYVVVFTELIVIIAFISRFWFDRQLTDLREQRVQKSTIVTSFKDTQNKFEQTRTMLNLIKSTWDSEGKIADRLSEIQNLTPAEVKYQSILISSQSASLTGFAPDSKSFSSILTLFQFDQNSPFKNVTVKQFGLAEDNSSGFDFTLMLTP